MASALSSTASESASARIRRPSASVLSTSTVLPLRIFSTSPGRIALPLGMFSTSGTYAVTRVFTPSVAQRRHRAEHRGGARHVGLHRLHAAGGLERQAAGVEHHALADERERPAARAGRLVRRPSRSAADARALADAEHAAHALRAQLRARRAPAPSRPCSRAACAPSPRTSAGDCAPAGSFTMSRAHIDRVGDHACRARARGVDLRAAHADEHAPSRSVGGVASDLYSRNWYAPSRTPFGERLRRGRQRRVDGRRVEQRGRDRRDLRGAPRERRAARGADRRASTRRASPTPTSSTAFAASASGRGTSSVWPELAVEAGLVHERGERRRRARRRPPSAPAPSSAVGARRDARARSARDAVGGVVTVDGEREGHGLFRAGGSGSVRAPGGSMPFLPAGERVHEVGEAVEVRHDLARAVEPARRARPRRPRARPGARRCGRGRARRRPGSRPGSTNSCGGSKRVVTSSMIGSSAATISAVTSVTPASSLCRFSGAVASSAPTTNSSRCSRTSSSSSSEPRSVSARASPRADDGFVDGAVGRRARRSSLGTRPPKSSAVVPSSPVRV